MHTNLISGLIHATIAAPGGGKNVHRIILGSQKILLLPVPRGGGGGGFPGGPENVPKNAYFSFCAEVNISLGTGLIPIEYCATFCDRKKHFLNKLEGTVANGHPHLVYQMLPMLCQ